MIEQILRDKIGLNYDSIGRKNVESAVAAHMKKYGVSSEKELLKLVTESEEHFEKLAQSVLVPETWFFRYSASFAFLAEYAKKNLAGQCQPFHILSIPCSSGEEPYSIAITLLNSGIPAELIRIDADDVSGPVLKKAQQAVYDSNSFRGGMPAAMQRFFLINNGKHEVIQPVKALVKFNKISLFDLNFTAGRPRYDLIFCRNLLIYFSREEQARAIAILTGILKENGILFLGHVESGMVSRDNFESVKFPSSFAFRKKTCLETLPATSVPTTIISAARPSRVTPGKSLHKTRRIKLEPAAAVTNQNRDAMLEKAAMLADRGALHEAEMLCLEYLNINKLNPVAYYTLGVVNLSSDRLAEAEKAFNKAVYLDPEYYAALVHLTLIKERQGEPSEASKLRKRAEKLMTASKP